MSRQITETKSSCIQVVHGRAHGKYDIQDSGYPHKLLGEGACCEKVCPREDQGHTEHKGKKDDGIGVERKIVARVVNAPATETLVDRILS